MVKARKKYIRFHYSHSSGIFRPVRSGDMYFMQ